MNLNKLTEKAQESVLTAQNLASEFNQPEITPEHLLSALVEQPGADPVPEGHPRVDAHCSFQSMRRPRAAA